MRKLTVVLVTAGTKLFKVLAEGGFVPRWFEVKQRKVIKQTNKQTNKRQSNNEQLWSRMRRGLLWIPLSGSRGWRVSWRAWLSVCWRHRRSDAAVVADVRLRGRHYSVVCCQEDSSVVCWELVNTSLFGYPKVCLHSQLVKEGFIIVILIFISITYTITYTIMMTTWLKDVGFVPGARLSAARYYITITITITITYSIISWWSPGWRRWALCQEQGWARPGIGDQGCPHLTKDKHDDNDDNDNNEKDEDDRHRPKLSLYGKSHK